MKNTLSVFVVCCLAAFLSFCSFPNTVFGQATANPASPEALLCNLLRFESVSGNEKAIGEYLSGLCGRKNLHVKVLSSTDSSYNFAASLYPLDANKPNIVLMSHLDVVPASNPQKWIRPPFSGFASNDTIYGRGAIDCKGLAAMQLWTLFEWANRAKMADLPYNLTFLGVSGEEVESKAGAPEVIANFLAELKPHTIFGEGGSGLTGIIPSKPNKQVFGISIAEKTPVKVRLVATVKAHGHGSVPPDLYANKRLVKSLIKLIDEKKEHHFSPLSKEMFRNIGRLEGGVKGYVIKHVNWSIFWPFVKKHFREGEIFGVLVRNTFVITQIESMRGLAANQIGNTAEAVLDCRLLPGDDEAKFLRKLQSSVGSKVKVSVIREGYNASPSPKNELFWAMKLAIEEAYPGAAASAILLPASTDNNAFRLQGIPVYGIIPAVLSRDELDGVHADNEFILLKNLNDGVRAYRLFMEKAMKLQF